MKFKEKIAVLALLLIVLLCVPETLCAKVDELAKEIRLWAKES